MKNTIELIKPWQGGVLAFFMSFIIFFVLLTISVSEISFERGWYLIFALSLIIALAFGFSIWIRMYRFRNWIITIDYTNKEEFMKKLNVYMFQMKFKLESNNENFLVYKMDLLLRLRILRGLKHQRKTRR